MGILYTYKQETGWSHNKAGDEMGIRRLKQYTSQVIGTMNSRYDELVRNQSDKETVHDLRVSVRKLMPVVNLLLCLEQRAGDKASLKVHQKRCKTLFKTLSAPRDLEVQIHLIQQLTASDSQQRQLIQPYTERLFEEKKALDRKLIPTIGAIDLSESESFFHDYLAKLTWDKKIFRTTLAHLHTQLEEKLRLSISSLKAEPEQYHDTRIHLKKYRYHVELESAVSGTDLSRISTLKQVQEQLGETNDLSVALELMSSRQASEQVTGMVRKLHQLRLKTAIEYLFAHQASLWVKEV